MKAQEAVQQNTDVHQQITALFRQEIRQLENLRDILEIEKQSLGDHNLEKMEEISKQKRSAVSAVESHSQSRFQYLKSLGINPFHENWFEQLNAVSNSMQELPEIYDYLISLTNQCRKLNQVNGLLINRREQLTSRVVNLLRANNTPEIYSESGQSESRSNARMLGKA